MEERRHYSVEPSLRWHPTGYVNGSMNAAINVGKRHLISLAPRWMKAARTKAIIAMADKMEARMANAFLRAVSAMKHKINMALLEQSISNNDRLLSYDAVFAKQWDKVLASAASVPSTAYGLAGKIGANDLGRIGITTAFDLKNPAAIAWAKTNSSKLIVEISDSTRAGIRSVIGSAHDLGIAPRPTARVIREMVGLTEKQSAAVFNYREKLIGEERKAEQVERMTAKYNAKLLKYRSENIARTEIMQASNEGLVESWRQAVGAGLLDAKNTNVEWLAGFDDRVCPICAPLNGTVFSYADIESGKASSPPIHPSCRCTLGISFQPVTAVKPTVNGAVAN